MDTTNEKKIIFSFGIRDILIIALLGLLWFQHCSGPNPEVEYKKGNYDSLYSVLSSEKEKVAALEVILAKKDVKLIASEAKSDSLLKVKVKADKKYIASSTNVRTEIKEGICDTNSVKEALNDCDSVRMASRRELSQKDSTITTLKEEKEILKEQKESLQGQVDASRTILKGQTDDIKALEKEIIKTKRRNKIKNIFTTIGVAVENALLIFALK